MDGEKSDEVLRVARVLCNRVEILRKHREFGNEMHIRIYTKIVENTLNELKQKMGLLDGSVD